MEKMDFQTFKKQIEALGVVYSIRDKIPYKIYPVVGDTLKIERKSTHNTVKIKMVELYDFYKKENYYDTQIAKDKNYISGRVQSPAVAILRALTENQKS